MRLSLFHAYPHTSNLGVSALFASAVSGIRTYLPSVEFTAFGSGLGSWFETCRVDSGDPVEVRFLGYRSGKKIYLPENLKQMRLMSRFGRVGGRLNRGIDALRKSNAVLDCSGGDSFTDMYPDNRIELLAGSKELAIALGRPLILLPQTFGPFDRSRDRAAKIVRHSAACFARDERSFETLKSLLGSDFNADRHRCGVDLAFGLDERSAEASIDSSLKEFIADSSRPLIGLNASGLIGNSPEAGRQKFGFKTDYRLALTQFLRQVFKETEARVILIPHVIGSVLSVESDFKICTWLKDQFEGTEDAQRILIASGKMDPSEVKWLIAQMDWFSGTRMHSTIAGLSSLVPTSTISYSDKALGVFESCGQGKEVLDPRILSTDEVVERSMDSFGRRDEIRKSLSAKIPIVKTAARQQMEDLTGIIRSL